MIDPFSFPGGKFFVKPGVMLNNGPLTEVSMTDQTKHEIVYDHEKGVMACAQCARDTDHPDWHKDCPGHSTNFWGLGIFSRKPRRPIPPKKT
jgi:hypothetical protein